MNVIGHTRHGYIIEASIDEVNAVIGGNKYDYHNRIGVGTEILLHEQWKAVRSAHENADNVQRAAKLLRGQAEALETLLKPIVDESKVAT